MLSNTCLKENFMILSQLAINLRKLFVSNVPWYSVIHGIEAKNLDETLATQMRDDCL